MSKRISNRNVYREYKKTSTADMLRELKQRPQFAEACKYLLAFQRVWDYTNQHADDWEGDLAGLLLNHGFDRATLKEKKICTTKSKRQKSNLPTKKS